MVVVGLKTPWWQWMYVWPFEAEELGNRWSQGFLFDIHGSILLNF